MGHGTPHVRPTVVGPALEARLRAALGAGERLADRLTSAFERAYGAGLGELRVHTGPEADLACRALDADAFTAGADVFFRDGAYAPHTRAGLELLAHEVAHAVEQGEADRRPRAAGAVVSRPGDACEARADALARAFTRRERGGLPGPRGSSGPFRPAGRAVRRLGGAERLVVQRHASWEHRLLGDAPPADLEAITLRRPTREQKLNDLAGFLAMWQDYPQRVTKEAVEARYPTIRTLVLRGSGQLVTYGELNTLADYLASPAAIDSLPEGILKPILQSVRQEGYYWVHRLLGKTPPKEGFVGAVVARIGWDFVDLLLQTKALDLLTAAVGKKGVDHYNAVVGRNACHFAPSSWYRWEQFHLIARDYATQARYAPTAAEKKRLTELAWINHGYSDHFLQDSFAAGHLVNKTLVMQWFIEWADGRPVPVADWQMVRHMTTARQPGLATRGLYDGFLDASQRGTARDPQTAEEQWSIERRMDVAGVGTDTFRSRMDAYKHYIRLMRNSGAQVSSGVLHDHFCKEGLYVASTAHPTAYEVYGDCHMMDGGDGVRIAAETAQLSQAAIVDLLSGGTTPITTAQIFGRFPTRVRQGGSLVSLQAWNDAQKPLAETLFLNKKIVAARVSVPRLDNLTLDTTGGWRWDAVPGSLTDIAVGGDGTVWGVSRTATSDQRGYTVQKLNGAVWETVEGAGGVAIAVDGAGVPYVLDTAGTVRKHAGGEWTALSAEGVPSGQTPRDIGAGSDGSVWVTTRSVLLRWTVDRWKQTPAAAGALSVAPSGLPWMAGTSNEIASATPGALLGKGWRALPGSASDIAVSTGVLPTAWMVGTDHDANAGGATVHAWNGGSWDAVPGCRGVRVAVGPDGTPWVVDVSGGVHHLVPDDVSLVAFATSDQGKVAGTATASRGALYPDDYVTIDGSSDLSGAIKGRSDACVYTIMMITIPDLRYDYQVRVDAKGPRGLNSGSLYLTFVDESGTQHKLRVWDSKRAWHTVSFRGPQPGIKEIRWSDKS
ncbi:eCIS core domain-containing protein [Actinomadura yumaensis]|uniref:DUF4157 domain-containing protein n=1 Tax=Actinomadura yumaensis TaxID=111807 RepID=A0ABW2CAD4_9ACTN